MKRTLFMFLMCMLSLAVVAQEGLYYKAVALKKNYSTVTGDTIVMIDDAIANDLKDIIPGGAAAVKAALSANEFVNTRMKFDVQGGSSLNVSGFLANKVGAGCNQYSQWHCRPHDRAGQTGIDRGLFQPLQSICQRSRSS
ncbi:hypothetical protein [Paraflavitalea speifideaquila]|uniref:hypothetical protein n=1 Tax=Paraflavitalea speifideaquila TaxID=3076558 RepID=UPI0028E641C7|nr:hypothetical protein [Paraflavitalea speifideiaquila]